MNEKQWFIEINKLKQTGKIKIEEEREIEKQMYREKKNRKEK